jgi:hypothetical protein
MPNRTPAPKKTTTATGYGHEHRQTGPALEGAIPTRRAWQRPLQRPPSPASANPASPFHANMPNCDIVPGMHDGVTRQPRPSWTQYPYGFDPNGKFLACVSFDGKSGVWTPSATVAGVKQVGTPRCSDNVSYCPTGFGSLAQAPDGRPLQCNTLGSATTGTWAALPQGLLG